MQDLRLYWEGTRESVLGSVERARASGQLVEVRQVGATEPGLVAAAVVLRTPTPPRHHPDKPRQSRRGVWLAAGAVGGIAVGVPSGWAARWLLEWAMAHATQILGALVALILLAAVVGRALGGRSGHCSGANTGH